VLLERHYTGSNRVFGDLVFTLTVPVPNSSLITCVVMSVAVFRNSWVLLIVMLSI